MACDSAACDVSVPFSDVQVAWILEAFKAGIGAAIRPVMQDILKLQMRTPATEYGLARQPDQGQRVVITDDHVRRSAGEVPCEQAPSSVVAQAADISNEAAQCPVGEHIAKHESDSARMGSNQSKAATVPCDQGATSSGSSKTRKRKERRTRAKVKHEYSQSKLLALRCCHGADNTKEPAVIGLGLEQRLNNLEVIITCAPVAFGSACFATCAADSEWGPYQSAGHQEGWLASEACNVPQEAFQVTASPEHSLRPETHTFNPDANDVSRPCLKGVITSLLNDSQEKIFDDLKATIQASSFPSELSNVLRGAGARLQRPYRFLEGQQIVHERVDKTIKVELDVDGYRYKPGDLQAASVAFITIANALPEHDLNDLCCDLA